MELTRDAVEFRAAVLNGASSARVDTEEAPQ
jgi:hypothetical protein